MRFTHTKCGGEINTKTRQCKRCKKKWDPISFKIDPVGIRPMVDSKGRPKLDRKHEEKEPVSSIPRWMMFAAGVPYLDAVVSKLPKWPRWARILTAAVIVTGLVLLVQFVIRR